MSNLLVDDDKLYTIAEGARLINTTYHRVIYAIAKDKIKLKQRDPDLIEKSELIAYAKENGLEINE